MKNAAVHVTTTSSHPTAINGVQRHGKVRQIGQIRQRAGIRGDGRRVVQQVVIVIAHITPAGPRSITRPLVVRITGVDVDAGHLAGARPQMGILAVVVGQRGAEEEQVAVQ